MKWPRIVVGFLTACGAIAVPAAAVPDGGGVAALVREYHRANQHRIIAELTELLSIPNIATDLPNIQRNADRLRAMLEQRGFAVRFLPIAGRGPLVYAELKAPAAARTVIFYCHYDGQPVDPSAWKHAPPFTPVLVASSSDGTERVVPSPGAGAAYDDNWRIYARSASDDKSPIVAILAALDALRAKNIPLAVNVKLLLDGEEEAGSPNLGAIVSAHRELFSSADVLITADGPVHQSGAPLVFFGNRGVVDVQLTLYGPARALHSGHYGNWAPNPAFHLARLLASMKDAEGRVLVGGFYDDVQPLSAREMEALQALPDYDATLQRELLIARPEGAGKKLVELINQPSLNIRGIRSAYVGAESQNIVPDRAEASLDLRLVRDIQPARQVERVIAHIRKQGFYVTRNEPTVEERLANPFVVRVVTSVAGYPAARTSMDLPVSQAVVRVVGEATGQKVVQMPTLGGSAPMYMFENLGLPVIGVPIVNHDNNQHAANENLRLGNFWRGVEIFAALLAELKW